MKQQRYWLLVGFVILLTLSACVQMPESNTTVSEISSAINSEETSINPRSSAAISEISSAINSEETTFNLKKQYGENELIDILSQYTDDGISWILAVFEYLSPDKSQKFIEVKVSEGNPDFDAGTRNYVFLNDLDHLFYRYWDNFQESAGVVWIDNDKAAIGAEIIINLKTGERKDIEPPVVNNENSGIVELHMRSGLYIEELDSLIYFTDYDHEAYMFQYNLKESTWTELFQRKIKGEFIQYYIHFKRENENEVSFNTGKNLRFSYNIYTKEFREIPFIGKDITYLADYYGE